MGTDGHAIKGHEVIFPHLDLEVLKERAKRVFTKDRMVTVALFGSTVAVLGAVLFALYSAMEANTILAPSGYLASLTWQLPVPGY